MLHPSPFVKSVSRIIKQQRYHCASTCCHKCMVETWWESTRCLEMWSRWRSGRGEVEGTHQAGLRQAEEFTDACSPETGGMAASCKTLPLSLLSFVSTHKLQASFPDIMHFQFLIQGCWFCSSEDTFKLQKDEQINYL